MKRLIGALAVAAAPLLVLGAAPPAEAGHCKCDKPAHHAKKPHASKSHHAKRQHSKSHHTSSSHSSYSGGVNTYGWQRQMGYGSAAPGYGVSHGPGYGYVGEANREGGHARSYSAYDVKTYEYDSGWVPGPVPPVPPGHGYSGYSSHYDSGWTRPGGAMPCPHPGAVMCLPPGHPPVGHAPMSHGYGGHEVTLHPGAVYGMSGGVAGPEGYGGYSTGRGGNVFVSSSTNSSAFAGARAAAFATGKGWRGHKGGHGGKH